jgi:membrane-associated phospholipid phosphatase
MSDETVKCIFLAKSFDSCIRFHIFAAEISPYRKPTESDFMNRIAILLLLLLPSLSNAQYRHSDAWDDVLAYGMYAMVFGLKACGVESTDGWRDLTLTTAATFVMSSGTTLALKHIVDEERPDHSDFRSFPSGHTTAAFASATMLRHQYGHNSRWISIEAYSLATFVAIDRVRLDRHHWHDVVVGAAIGAGMGELTWYLSRKVLKKQRMALGFDGRQVQLVVCL